MITATGITLKETAMQQDTYYRGYRLSELPSGMVYIYAETELLSSAVGKDNAKSIVDEWLNAR